MKSAQDGTVLPERKPAEWLLLLGWHLRANSRFLGDTDPSDNLGCRPATQQLTNSVKPPVRDAKSAIPRLRTHTSARNHTSLFMRQGM